VHVTGPDDKRARARELAAESLAGGDATGWVERLYAEAEAGEAVVPWADLVPNPHLVSWWDDRPAPADALVVGCGFGDDAAWLADRGVGRVVAFDVASTAVEAAERRFGRAGIEFVTADVLAPPADWLGAFELVVEVNTLQVLPPELRAPAASAIASTVASGGTLLVVCRGREPDDPEGTMPWPLLRSELVPFEGAGLRVARFDELVDDEARRFRVEYQRPRVSN